ncbi:MULTISPECIES: formylmethanofuran dehydrogenase subunit C [unclassified Caballeronia]|uniref:formylmethanofuran dehydrogenase subunit C n=1 Tax=unclassified Caballeronia TaxID=2646786 RepID=UPI00285615CD|nr:MULTISPECIES: formylmethanofuran dehydrogenase subunit C [unclassified Caballeronia]MDR5739984.1 formylmethanofuran dehydrogenase subunit C [Caballeronia sp. LZ016]MDR5807375.1 formylmethanofuran dehydrogenase subunit C [Caballeronia sp. LZ019]
MNAITLRVKNAPGFRVDASKLLPQTLAQMSPAELDRMSLQGDGDMCALSDLFDIAQTDAADVSLAIEGDAAWLDRLGASLTAGTLTVRGNAGDYAGIGMTGGKLSIEGNAGRFTACEMQGGRIDVSGHVGDFAASALPGNMEGMSGGVLAVRGDAGARLADRMRRGTILIGGNAGDFAASRIVAGTVCVAGQTGAHLGYGMRRGTVVLLRNPSRIGPTFTQGGQGFDVFWLLLARMLAKEFGPFSTLEQRALPRRYAGDLAVDGRGELLIANS